MEPLSLRTFPQLKNSSIKNDLRSRREWRLLQSCLIHHLSTTASSERPNSRRHHVAHLLHSAEVSTARYFGGLPRNAKCCYRRGKSQSRGECPPAGPGESTHGPTPV